MVDLLLAVCLRSAEPPAAPTPEPVAPTPEPVAPTELTPCMTTRSGLCGEDARCCDGYVCVDAGMKLAPSLAKELSVPLFVMRQ